MKKETMTIEELAKMLNLSKTVMRNHLCCFEKYRIKKSRPFAFLYNYSFLLDLRKFYFEKIQSIGFRYKYYKNVVIKLNKIIKLWEKTKN